MARLSVASNSLLILLKFFVGFVTGSVSIISEAVHSMTDLAASVIAYVSIKLAGKPPDETHPYGHEKIENLSSVVEALLIIFASLYIIVEALKKLLHHSHVEKIGWGLVVMMVSALTNAIVSRMLYKVARAEESIALETDALHLKADAYTSAGVALGLIVLWLTKLYFLDQLVAIVIAVLILKEAYEMLQEAYQPLIDAQLSDEEIQKIKFVVNQYSDVFVDLHDLRTRRAGKTKHIDLHLVAPHDMTIKEYHRVCDLIEKDLETALKNTKVLIHVEPTASECQDDKNNK